MRANNLASLKKISKEDIEIRLSLHTTQRVKPTPFTRFSWSASRHSLYDWCKRKYYLHYYGARRVRQAKDEVISAVWWLKQAIPRKVWVGSVIHHAAQKAILAYRAGRKMRDDEITDLAMAYHQGGLEASQRGTKFDDQWVVFTEDVYPDILPTVELNELQMRIDDLAQTLVESDAYAFICEQAPSTIKEVDKPFQSFTLANVEQIGDVRVFAIPDVLLQQEDKRITIMDWKTGDVERESIRNQAGVYQLYAHTAYGVDEDAIDVQIIDLKNNRTVEPMGGTPDIAEANNFVRGSIKEMVSKMESAEFNTVALRDYPMIDDAAECEHCNFKLVCKRG